MKKLKRFLLPVIFLVVFAPLSVNAQDDAKKAPCVVLSKWDDCSQYCTKGKCYQFTNNCTYKVKVTWKYKNSEGKWTTGEVYLDPNEVSQDAMFCDCVEMKWSYAQSDTK